MTQTHAPLEWETPLFHQAIAQFEQAVPYADVSDAIVERLSLPERSVIVSVPIKLDDGRRTVFPGYRVQHSSVLGPTKGGIRYDEHVSLGECAALSMWMTWKCALLRLPYGGAKGGIRCDPRALSLRELQAVTRRFTAELLPFIGPQEDIPGARHGHRRADDGLDDGHVLDAGRSRRPGDRHGQADLDRRLRLPRRGDRRRRGDGDRAGVPAARLEPGRRSAASCRASARSARSPPTSCTNAARSSRRSPTCPAGSTTSTGSTSLPLRDDARARPRHARRARGRAPDERGAARAACDILVLAALEEQVTGENAPRVKARMIAEGANGPTTLEADAIFAERGVPVLPDILTNAGGVTVSYFEWVQDLGRLFWDRDDIRKRLADKMGDAFDRVWELARDAGPDPAPGRARHRDPRGGGCVERPRALPVTLVRDGMLSDPAVLAADATAQEAAEHLMRPDVRVVLVVDGGGTLVGVVTPDSLVEHVVAAGLDPRSTPVSAAAAGTAARPRRRRAARRRLPAARGGGGRARARRRAGPPRRCAVALGRAAAPRRGRTAAGRRQLETARFYS